MPLVLDLYIRQIANNEAFGVLLLELSVQNVLGSGFITRGFVGLILSYSVGRNQSLLFHDSSNATSGHDESLFLELNLDFASAVSFAVLVENLHNGCGEVIFFGWFLRFIIERTF